MTFIDAKTKSVRELLDSKKYSIEYYQREYKWGEEQIKQLITDLEDKFYETHRPEHQTNDVKNYPEYFLGSIIMVDKNNDTFIIDGQQRITSLTLLFIYIHRILKNENLKATVLKLIQSDTFGETSFNLNIDERKFCLEKLMNDGNYTPKEQDNDSVKNILSIYEHIEEIFPETVKSILDKFVYWLVDKVFFVEIRTQNDQDAYTIFETMNDRGLSLTPSEMLKGYLLSNITDEEKRNNANDNWKKTNFKLIQDDPKNEGSFISSWLRSKYSRDIRDRKKDASKKDFDLIGTEFHKWVRENKDFLNLGNSDEFYNFIVDKHTRFSEIYLKILNYSKNFDPIHESIYFNAYNNITLQNTVLLSPVTIDDDNITIDKKLRMVSRYLDIFTTKRIINHKSIDYNTLVVNLFNLTKEIRDKSIEDLKTILVKKLDEQEEDIPEITNFKLSPQLKRKVRFLLSRITYFIEKQTDQVGADFEKFIKIKYIKKPYEIEHIWSKKYEYYKNDFSNEDDFLDKRQSIGALILVPRGENQSYGDKHYEEKVEHYSKGNILAQSLTNICYQSNPSFIRFMKDNNLPFEPYDTFNLDSLKKRNQLYKEISNLIWNKDKIEYEMNN